MLLKLQYRPSRWLRLVETMANTHFIKGVHNSLINKFPFTQVGSFKRFLKWQRLNNPQVVAQDKDLQHAIIRMEAKKTRHQSGSRSRGPPQEREEDDTEGSVRRL